MKTHSRVLAACLSSIVIAGLAACSSPAVPEPSLTPVMDNPPPAPVPVLVTEPAAVTAIPETARPVPTTDLPNNNVATDASAVVPGVTDPWFEIKDYPFERRSDFVARIDASTTLLSGAVSVARLSPPKSGSPDTHATDIRRMDGAMTALDQARATLVSTNADRWEGVKNDFHIAWQNAQGAYAQARASGN